MISCKAAQAFARRDSAEAHYNQGNARLMLGAYDAAIACYDRALARRPDWQQALQNRAIALVRAQRVAQKGGDLGDQQIGADEIVFDKDKPNEGQDTELEGGKTLTDQEIQALWLRRVQTRPADFLRAKFAWQQALRAEAGSAMKTWLALLTLLALICPAGAGGCCRGDGAGAANAGVDRAAGAVLRRAACARSVCRLAAL